MLPTAAAQSHKFSKRAVPNSKTDKDVDRKNEASEKHKQNSFQFRHLLSAPAMAEAETLADVEMGEGDAEQQVKAQQDCHE